MHNDNNNFGVLFKLQYNNLIPGYLYCVVHAHRHRYRVLHIHTYIHDTKHVRKNRFFTTYMYTRVLCTVRVLHECHVPVCVHQGTEYYMYWLPGTGSLPVLQ